jgi:tetratricopeptide (TPR) repeat protein
MKLWYALAALLTLGLAGGGAGLWWYGRPAGPQPPVIDLAGADDPALQAALGEIRQGVLRKPHAAEAWGSYGKSLFANGYPDEAAVCFARAAALAPAEARWPYFEGLALRQNSLDAAVEAFGRAASRVDPDGPDALTIRLRYAEALINAGRLEEARPLVKELAARLPDDPRVHLALGTLAADANDLDGALAHLRRCAEAPLTRQRASAQLASVYQLKGDAKAAARCRARARSLGRDPDGPDPFVEEYLALGVGREAQFLRAESLMRDGKFGEAVPLLERLAGEQPGAAEVHVKLGMALAQVGAFGRAEAELRAGLAASPGNVQGHYFLAVALFQQAERSGGRAGFEAAAAEARAAVAGKKDHAYAHLYLGLALAKLGKPEQSLAELRQAARYSPDSADPHLHLGRALLAAGRRAEGLDHLEKAVEFASPGDARPREALKEWRQKVGEK